MKIVDGLYVLPTDEKARQQGCYLDFTLPDKIISFAEKCCTLQTDDYSGKSGRALKLLPWQEALIRTLYGWRNKHGDLRFTYCSTWVGRRQGKSVLCAVLATYFMLTSARSKVPIIASDMNEATAVYDRCYDFVVNSPLLYHKDKKQSRCSVQKSHLTIRDEKGLGEIVVLSSEKTGKLGKGVQLLVADELAAWKAHAARHIWNMLHDSLKDKVNAVMVSISTPQHDLSSLGREKYLQAEAVLTGESDDITVLPIIYKAPENFREDIEGALRQALPSLDVTTPLHKYLEEWAAIENTIDEPRFLIMNLGLWVSSPEVWIPNVFWDACKADFSESQFYGRNYDAIAVGMDWGASYDLTAYTIIIQKGELFYLFPRFFIPKDIAQERTEKDKVPYTSWVLDRNNNLFLTPGDVVDAMEVLKVLNDDRAKFGFNTVRFDKTKMALVDQLLQQNGFNCVAVSQQVPTMAPAFEKFETLIRARQIRHNNNPVANWCLGNCKPKKVNDSTMIVKSGDRNKIDYVDATCIGLTHWLDTKNTTPVLPPGQKWAISF